MKKFILTVLCVSVFFLGLGGLVERAGARFKSDDRAVELIKRARQAIGGDAAINNVRSMTILGKATKTFQIEGVARTDQGDAEINFELPNKMSRMVRIGDPNGAGDKIVDKQVDVVVMRQGEGGNVQWKTEDGTEQGGVKKIVIKKADGTTQEMNGNDRIIVRKGDGNTKEVTVTSDGPPNGELKRIVVNASGEGDGVKFRTNELFRTTLALLATAPEGVDVNYTYVGEGSVDGAACDIVAASDGGPAINLYLDKSTGLPRMISYQAPKPMIVMLRKDGPKPDGNNDVQVFSKTVAAPDMTEFQVKFSDFRAVDGLQLPFKWTQTAGGKDDEVLDITSYQINPSNIAEKFKEMPTKVFVRTQKQ
ncbi:MAG: hypothetical protein JSS81_20535 [Acidobacteria bacterium]|nr:hypothetical protein [Acidobacteriota bacterium]